MRMLACALVAVGACGGSQPPRPAPTLDQQVLAAANATLECMPSGGASCLAPSPAAAGWAAQLELEHLATDPPAQAANHLLRAADELARPIEIERRVGDEARVTLPLARDLSCRAVATRNVGAELATRRALLVERAENLGLGSTVAGRAVGALAATAEPLATARLVEARCGGGAIFLLMAPPRDIPPDEDPAAHAGGGWHAFATSFDEHRLLRGPPGPGPAPAIADRERTDVVDPWIPVTEIDL